MFNATAFMCWNSCIGDDESPELPLLTHLAIVNPRAHGRVPHRGLIPQIRMKTDSLQLDRMVYQWACEWLFYHYCYWLPRVPIIKYARTMLITIMDPGVARRSDPAIAAPNAWKM